MKIKEIINLLEDAKQECKKEAYKQILDAVIAAYMLEDISLEDAEIYVEPQDLAGKLKAAITADSAEAIKIFTSFMDDILKETIASSQELDGVPVPTLPPGKVVPKNVPLTASFAEIPQAQASVIEYASKEEITKLAKEHKYENILRTIVQIEEGKIPKLVLEHLEDREMVDESFIASFDKLCKDYLAAKDEKEKANLRKRVSDQYGVLQALPKNTFKHAKEAAMTSSGTYLDGTPIRAFDEHAFNKIVQVNQDIVETIGNSLKKKFVDQPDHVTDAYKSIAREHYTTYQKAMKAEESDRYTTKCFVSSPGMGKTVQIEEMAKIMGAPLVRIDMSGRTSSDILGVPPEYANPRPGLLAEATTEIITALEKLKQEKQVNENAPVILFLDELDKMQPDAFLCLMDYLDSNKKTVFDTYLRCHVVKSPFKIIAAANDWSKVNPIVKSRLNMVHIPDYTYPQKLSIIKGSMLRSKLGEIYDFVNFKDPAIKYIIDTFVTEGGVREADSILKDIKGKLIHLINTEPEHTKIKTAIDAQGALHRNYAEFREKLLNYLNDASISTDIKDKLRKYSRVEKNQYSSWTLEDEKEFKLALKELIKNHDKDLKLNALNHSYSKLVEDSRNNFERKKSEASEKLVVDEALLKKMKLSSDNDALKKECNRQIIQKIEQEIKSTFPNITAAEINDAAQFFKSNYIPNMDFKTEERDKVYISPQVQLGKRLEMIADYFTIIKDNLSESAATIVYKSEFEGIIYGRAVNVDSRGNTEHDGKLGDLREADEKLTEFRNKKMLQKYSADLEKVFGSFAGVDPELCERRKEAALTFIREYLAVDTHVYNKWILNRLQGCEDDSPENSLEAINRSEYKDPAKRMELYAVHLKEKEKELTRQAYRKDIPARRHGNADPAGRGEPTYDVQQPTISVEFGSQSARSNFFPSISAYPLTTSAEKSFVNQINENSALKKYLERSEKAGWKTLEGKTDQVLEFNARFFDHLSPDDKQRKKTTKSRDIKQAKHAVQKMYGQEAGTFLPYNRFSGEQQTKDHEIKKGIRENLTVKEDSVEKNNLIISNNGRETAITHKTGTAVSANFISQDPDLDTAQQVVEHLVEVAKVGRGTMEISGCNGNLSAAIKLAALAAAGMTLRDSEPSFTIKFSNDGTLETIRKAIAAKEDNNILKNLGLKEKDLQDFKIILNRMTAIPGFPQIMMTASPDSHLPRGPSPVN